MFYEFECREHGKFTVRQSIHDHHVAFCPQCGLMARRLFGSHEVIWADRWYRPDGSIREDKDYACLKG